MNERTRGSVALMRLPNSQAEIASALHVAQPMISRWISGEKKPSAENRAALQKVFGIDPAWWNESLSDPGDPKTFEHKSVRDRAIEVERAIHDLIEEAKKEPTPKAKAIAIERCIKMLTALGKLTGESLDISEAMILRTPAWRRIKETIVRVLEDGGDDETLQRIGEALVNLSGEEAA